MTADCVEGEPMMLCSAFNSAVVSLFVLTYCISSLAFRSPDRGDSSDDLVDLFALAGCLKGVRRDVL